MKQYLAHVKAVGRRRCLLAPAASAAAAAAVCRRDLVPQAGLAREPRVLQRGLGLRDHRLRREDRSV